MHGVKHLAHLGWLVNYAPREQFVGILFPAAAKHAKVNRSRSRADSRSSYNLPRYLEQRGESRDVGKSRTNVNVEISMRKIVTSGVTRDFN